MRRRTGFTLIELLVVLAILAVLLTIATPRYVQHVERAREATLRASLKVMRGAIDKFAGDQGRLPASLDELVARSYLREVPLDPVTEKRDTWVVLTQAEVDAALPNSPTVPPDGGAARSQAGVADVRSGAPGKGADGTPFQDW